MKFSTVVLAAFTGLVSAAPTPTVDDGATHALDKRASVTETCNIGYASTNGGTKGGKGGSTTTVSTLSQFTAAAEASKPLVVVVKGNISGSTKVRVESDKTIIGATGAKLTGVGLYVHKKKNVIIRNLSIKDVKAANGDAINIQASQNVWVDHCDLSSNQNNGKDYYDGLLDINHGSEWVTVSNTYLHDHYKASLVGHSDNNAGEDTGKLHVTYANNHWKNVNSRNPSVRFGTVHIYNNFYSNVGSTGLNTRMGAKVLIESSTFENTKTAITSVDSKTKGTATVKDVNLGGSVNDAPSGSFPSVPYSYSNLGSSKVKSAVVGVAGATLKF